MLYYFHIQSFSISLFGFIMFHIFSFSSHSVDMFHSPLLGLPNFPHGVSSGLSRCLIRPCSVVWASRPVELQIRLDLKEESCCASSSMAEEWQNLSLSLPLFSRSAITVALCLCIVLSVIDHLFLFPPYVLIRLSLHPPVHSGKFILQHGINSEITVKYSEMLHDKHLCWCWKSRGHSQKLFYMLSDNMRLNLLSYL